MTNFQQAARAAVCALGVLLAGAAAATGYPEEPIRLRVPCTPGGSTDVLARSLAELLQQDTGTQILHVPYEGSAPALNGVLGGETQFMIDAVDSSVPLVSGGRLRALAITGARRAPALPDVPTVAESGVPGFDISTWFGLLVPRQTPPAVVARLNASVAAAVRDPAFRTPFEDLGTIVPPPIDAAAFARSGRR